MIKKLFIITIFLFLSNCGFSPIYLSNENSIIRSIYKIQINGDQNLGTKLVNNLNVETNEINKYLIILNCSSGKDTISKSSANVATSYNMFLDVEISILIDKEVLVNKKFRKDFTYNNRDNKFELLTYENSVKDNLINELSDEILLFLNLGK